MSVTVGWRDEISLLCSCDLDLDPYDFDIRTWPEDSENQIELSRSRLSKVGAFQTDRRDRQYHAAFNF